MNLTNTTSALVATATSLLGVVHGVHPAPAGATGFATDIAPPDTAPSSPNDDALGHGEPVIVTGGQATCTDSPPQDYVLFPLRGCSMTPPYSNPRWANESCFGDTGAYYCREVAGHPQLNIAPSANWFVYKTDIVHYSGHSKKWGSEMVHRSGYVFEGCGSWVRVTYGDGSTNYTAVCDYKMNKDNSGPRNTTTDPGGWDYFYDVLRNWGRSTYENEFSCAVTITGTWTGATDVVDIVPACGGVFR
jgi:hypothetical protein